MCNYSRIKGELYTTKIVLNYLKIKNFTFLNICLSYISPSKNNLYEGDFVYTYSLKNGFEVGINSHLAEQVSAV